MISGGLLGRALMKVVVQSSVCRKQKGSFFYIANIKKMAPKRFDSFSFLPLLELLVVSWFVGLEPFFLLT